MPDIEFRLKAIDEATPVIDRARQKMNDFNRSQANVGTGSRQKMSGGGGGAGGFLGGGGKIAAGAGITIIAQAALQALQKINQRLMEASPYLASINQQFKTATDIYLRPLGDSLAKALAPKSEYALKVAEKRADSIAKIDEEFGVAGAALATFGYILYDVKMALWEFNYGVWDTLSKVYMWPIDKLGDILGVDLPGSLSELLEEVFGITGGFQGVREFLEDDLPARLQEAADNFKKNFMTGVQQIADTFSEVGDRLWSALSNAGNVIGSTLSGFGTWLWESLSGVFSNAWNVLSGFGTWLYDGVKTIIGSAWNVLSGFGSWLYDGVKGKFSSAWDTITGFGSWLYNKLKNALSGLGTEAYNAFHNAIASMLNSIANIELPLVGKPFKGLFGTIPMLNTGGLITGDGLAFLHAGERVLNPAETKRTGMAPMAQGQQVTINVNAPIYGVDDLERTFRDLMSREQMGYSGYR